MKLLPALLLMPSLASAVPVTYQFSGQSVYGTGPTVSGLITLETDPHITYFNDPLPDAVDTQNAWGELQVRFTNPIISVTLNVDNLSLTYSGEGGSGSIFGLMQNESNPRNLVEWYYGAWTDPTKANAFDFLYAGHCTYPACPTSSEFLSNADLHESDMMLGTGHITFRYSAFGYSSGTYAIDYITKVPEPATALLFSLGLVGVLLSARQRNLTRRKH